MSVKIEDLDNFNNNFNLDIDLEYKNVEDNEKDDRYRKCFLEFLKIDNYEDNLVVNKINLLYECTKNIEDLNKIYTDKSEKMQSNNPSLGVIIMLNYNELDDYIKLLRTFFN